MSFIRPEAVASLRLYGEPALFALLGIAGLWQGWTVLGRGNWAGVLLVIGGILALLALAGAAERALVAWRGRRAGPGTVTVREGQIAYFGPYGGAILALDALISVDLVGADNQIWWELSDEIGQTVRIPGGAEGAVSLLDRLGTLPDFDHRTLVQAMSGAPSGRHRLWRRGAQRPLTVS